MGESKYCRCLNGIFTFSFLAHVMTHQDFRGAIAAAFTSQFPHLVDEGVALIASAGLMEVVGTSFSVAFVLNLMWPPEQSTYDLLRTTKFMSSPFIQSLTSRRPLFGRDPQRNSRQDHCLDQQHRR